MAARRSPVNAELVLNAEHVDAVDVQEIGCASIRIEIGLRDLEAHSRRICVSPARIVHRQDEPVDGRELGGERVRQMRRERGDAALARHVIAEHGDGADGTGGVDAFDGSSKRARGSEAVRVDRHARRSTDVEQQVYARSANVQGTVSEGAIRG